MVAALGRVWAGIGWFVEDVLPWIAMAAIVAVAAITSGQATDIPSQDVWSRRPFGVSWATIVLVLSLMGAVGVIVADLKVRRKNDGLERRLDTLEDEAGVVARSRDVALRSLERERLCHDLDEALGVLVGWLVENPRSKLDPFHLSAIVWRVPELETELAMERRWAMRHWAPSAVHWTKGKGAIGLCWQNGLERVYNMTKLRSVRTEADVLAAGNDALGMSLADIEATKRYTAVWVRPLTDPQRRVVGILAVGSTKPGTLRRLQTASRSEVAVDAAILVGRVFQQVLDFD
jgi:hypothetical protein